MSFLEGIEEKFAKEFKQTKKNKKQFEKELQAFSLFPEFKIEYENMLKDKLPKYSTNKNNLIIPYLLNITSKMPEIKSNSILKWAQHGDCPDIDTDIEDRDLALQIYYDIFGEEKVLPVSNYNTIKLKTAIKDAARLHGIEPSRIERVTTKMNSKMNEVSDNSFEEDDDDEDGWSALSDVIESIPEMQDILNEYPGLESDINRIAVSNALKSVSRHAGGIIIADELNHISPTINSKNIIQIGFTKNNCESMGFIKLDLLGLKTLRIISSCIHQIIYTSYDKWKAELESEVGSFKLEECIDGEKSIFDPFLITSSDFDIIAIDNKERYPHRYKFIRHFYKKYLSPRVIDFNDQKVYERVYQNGAFCGIFQMDSVGMRNTTMSFKPNCIEDISAAVAIYRPGPLNAGVHEMYAENKAKVERGEKISEHEIIDKILEPTYGLIVYQEQIMELGAALGNYTKRQVQQLRQNVIKKGKDKLTPKLAEERQLLKEVFIKGSVENNYEESKALELWDKIEGFAAYSFNKSHSVCYGMLSYITAYLLTYYKTEWYTAVLSAAEDPKARKKVISEAIGDGLLILGPDLIESKSKWSYDENSKGLRFGFSDIKGIGEKAVLEIIKGQNGTDEIKGFSNVWEFFQSPLIKWTAVNKNVIYSLIISGAFDPHLDEILKYFNNKRQFFEAFASYKDILKSYDPDIAVEKIKESIERSAKRRDAAIEKGKEKIPKIKEDIFQLEDWDRSEYVTEQVKILNWMPEPELVEYRKYSRKVLAPKMEEFIEIEYTEEVPVDKLICNFYENSANGNIYSIDEHPKYDKAYAPKCWFRILSISERKTKAGKTFLVINAMGLYESVSITCWEPDLFENFIPSDYCLAFVVYDEKWGFSIARRKGKTFKFPVERYPSIC